MLMEKGRRVIGGILFTVVSLSLGAQTTLHWSGDARDPLIGGNGVWNLTDPAWSSSSSSYSGTNWINGSTYNAVLGGSTGGTITLDNVGISGPQLSVLQNYTLDLQGHSASFASLVFSGAGSNLTITGGGSFGAALSAGMVTITGASTTFNVGGSYPLTGGTIVAKNTSIIANSSTGTNSSAAIQFHDSATFRTQGLDVTVGSINSATNGAGIIENNHGIRASAFTVDQTSGTQTYSGAIRDSSSGPQTFSKLTFNKNGAGTLILDGAQKTYTGGTTVSGGTLQLAANNVLPDGGSVIVGLLSPGTLDLNNHDQSIGSLSGGLSSSNVMLGSATLTLTGAPSENLGASFSGVISGSGGVIKTGTGVQYLGGNNTYTGGTVVQGGTLGATSSSAFGSGPVIFKAGTTFDVAVNTFAQSIAFESGEVTIRPGGGMDRTLSGVLSGGATLNFAGNIGTTYTLTGNNTYNGGTRVSGVSLQIGSDSALGDPTGALTLDNAGLKWSAAFDLAATRNLILIGSNVLSPNGFSTTISQNIAGTGSLSLNSNGRITLTGNNTFSGGIYLGQGSELVVYADSALGAASSSVTIGGTLHFTTSTTLDSGRTLRIDGSTSTIQVDSGATVAIPVAIGQSGPGNASLNKTGAGTLVLGNVASYGGSTIIADGTLRLNGANNILPTSQSITVNGTLDLNGTNQSVNGLSGFGKINPNGGTFTLTGSGNYSFNAFTGSGTVRKLSAGTLSLGGDASFAGTFQLEIGTLNLSGNLGSSSNLTISSGATLYGSGTAGAIALHSGGIIAPGDGRGVLHVGDTTLAGGGHYSWEIGNTASATGWDSLQITGSLTIAATAADTFVIDAISLGTSNIAGLATGFDPSQNYSFTIATTSDGIIGYDPSVFSLNLAGFQNNYTGVFGIMLTNSGHDLSLIYTAVPEPRTITLLISAAGMVLVARLRRRWTG